MKSYAELKSANDYLKNRERGLLRVIEEIGAERDRLLNDVRRHQSEEDSLRSIAARAGQRANELYQELCAAQKTIDQLTNAEQVWAMFGADEQGVFCTNPQTGERLQLLWWEKALTAVPCAEPLFPSGLCRQPQGHDGECDGPRALWPMSGDCTRSAGHQGPCNGFPVLGCERPLLCRVPITQDEQCNRFAGHYGEHMHLNKADPQPAAAPLFARAKTPAESAGLKTRPLCNRVEGHECGCAFIVNPDFSRPFCNRMWHPDSCDEYCQGHSNV
jgi:hypothetical protein